VGGGGLPELALAWPGIVSESRENTAAKAVMESFFMAVPPDRLDGVLVGRLRSSGRVSDSTFSEILMVFRGVFLMGTAIALSVASFRECVL
jgi:hypothetical protein